MRRVCFGAALVICLNLAAGSGAATRPQTEAAESLPTGPLDPRLNQGPKSEAVGDKVMVSTQLPIVTAGALQVLRDGGNAVDAMITAVFLQHVNDIHQVSVFGSMSALYYDAATAKYYALSAVAERPLSHRGERGDPSKVAVGGTVRGLEALWKRFGSRSWASYLEPAIASAEQGALVTSFMYGVNYTRFEEEGLADYEGARELYMPNGFLVPVGHLWKMPAMAETLQQVASQGADYLYTGAWGQKFVEEANRLGGRVSMEDMGDYQARWEEPVRFVYRGHEIIGSPPPDTGGLVVGYNLNILENFDLKAAGHYTESAETLETMSRVFGRVRRETRGAILDPMNFRIPAHIWLSKDYGKMAAELVRNTMIVPGVELSAPAREVASLLHRQSEESPTQQLGSNHNVIVDAEGNWISLLHTGHGGAPGVHIDGVRATGSEARAFTSGPGRRVVLPITGILIARDDKPWLAMGTPGSPPQPVTEVLVNLLDFEMPPQRAVDAPRFWAFRGNEPVVQIESRISEEVREGMARHGIQIKDLGEYNWRTGSMQIIWRDSKTGKLHGVTDPRRLGLAAGF